MTQPHAGIEASFWKQICTTYSNQMKVKASDQKEHLLAQDPSTPNALQQHACPLNIRPKHWPDTVLCYADASQGEGLEGGRGEGQTTGKLADHLGGFFHDVGEGVEVGVGAGDAMPQQLLQQVPSLLLWPAVHDDDT